MFKPSPLAVRDIAMLNVLFGAFMATANAFLAIAPMFFLMASMSPSTPVELMLGQKELQPWTTLARALGAIAALALFAAGVGLFVRRDWGRKLSVAYGAYGVIVGVAGLVANVMLGLRPLADEYGLRISYPTPTGGVEAFFGSICAELLTSPPHGDLLPNVCAGLLTLVYPVLLIYFMTRPTVAQGFPPKAAG